MAIRRKDTRTLPVTRARVEPDPIFRKLYRPLGAIAFTFADLEADLTRTINALLGTSWREGAAMEWLMQNVSNRIELFYFLAVQITAPPSQDATPLLGPRDSKWDEGAKALRALVEAIYGELQQA